MLLNQVKVLIQRARIQGKMPMKLILSKPMREALKNQSPCGLYRTTDQGDFFASIPIVVDLFPTHQPILRVKDFEPGMN